MKQMPFEEFVKVRTDRDFRLIDVREADEWADVHVDGAELHPLSKIRQGSLPDEDGREVALICRSGARSAVAAGILEDAGWQEITNISDGTLGAIEAGEDYVIRG